MTPRIIWKGCRSSKRWLMMRTTAVVGIIIARDNKTCIKHPIYMKFWDTVWILLLEACLDF